MVYIQATPSMGDQLLYSTKPPGLLLSAELIIDICLPSDSVVVLMAHILCLTFRTQPLKQVMIPVFFFFSFSFIAAGLRLQLWWFKLVIFVVAVAVCFIFGEYFSMLRSKRFVD